MSVFFDTNVLVYCTDTTAPEKQAIARALVSQASASGDALVSTQVLIELFNAYFSDGGHRFQSDRGQRFAAKADSISS